MTAEDLGVFLMELEFFSLNMNLDGSLPTARFKSLWEAMLEKEDIDRGWDYKRFAAMRNYLSSLGLLEWEDERYSPGAGGQKGQAAKWRATDELLKMLKEVKKEEEKDTSLAGTTLINISELNQQKTYLRPIQVVNIGRRRDFHPIFLDMGLLAV